MIGFIINPLSGNGKGASIWKHVQQELDKRHIPYACEVTSRSGEACQLACKLTQDFSIETLIVVGGDGTIHEAAGGLFSSDRPATCRLGVIPAGTGNDFAKAHGIPTHPIEALNLALDHQRVISIDVIKTDNCSISVNNIGAGFDGLVAKLTNEASYKKLLNRFGLGKLSYFITMLRVFWIYQPTKVSLEIDDIHYELPNTWLVATTNIAYYGGSMQICPHAIADDGILDVMVICSPSRLKLLPIMFSVYAGKHTAHPAVTFYRGRQITVQSEIPLLLQADGEPAGSTPLKLEVHPSALLVIGGV